MNFQRVWGDCVGVHLYSFHIREIDRRLVCCSVFTRIVFRQVMSPNHEASTCVKLLTRDSPFLWLFKTLTRIFYYGVLPQFWAVHVATFAVLSFYQQVHFTSSNKSIIFKSTFIHNLLWFDPEDASKDSEWWNVKYSQTFISLIFIQENHMCFAVHLQFNLKYLILFYIVLFHSISFMFLLWSPNWLWTYYPPALCPLNADIAYLSSFCLIKIYIYLKEQMTEEIQLYNSGYL